MAEPRRVRTQVERDADGVAWRPNAHPWQEYNAHGNTCHFPGCHMAEDEHAQPLGSPPDPDIWVTTESVNARPPRRRWWHRLTRRAL